MGGGNSIQNPHQPCLTCRPFRFFFFFLAQSRERGSDAEYLECFSRLKIAWLLGYIFWGKVGFPPLCPHWSPDTGGALCGCVCGEQTLLITESGAGRLTIVSSFHRPGRQLLRSCHCLDGVFFFCGVAAPPSWFLFKCGSPRCGLASGVSGSSERQGCLPWAVCSPSQRIGEMLLRGQ